MAIEREYVTQSRASVARLLSVSQRTVADWCGDGLPREQVGPRRFDYYLKDIVQWWRNHEVRKALADAGVKPKAGKDAKPAIDVGNIELPDEDPLLSMGDTYYGELYRKRKAEAADIDNQKKRGELIGREVVRTALLMLASRLKDAGELLTEQFGAEAAELLLEAVNDCEDQLEHGLFADCDATDDD